MAMDSFELGLRVLEFDPANPQSRFFSTASQMAASLSVGLTAEPVQFPAGLAPTPDPPATAPDPTNPLPRADVVIVTWTVAEADTLARLLTPGVALSEWFEYTSNLAQYLPKVNNPRAPFNNAKSPRYFHSLGIYYPITLVGKRVLCFKSGLHLDHDTQVPAPADLPMLDLWRQILAETGAEFIITTGTGGGVGADVLLGDVIVAAKTVFDCTTQFAQKPFHNAVYKTSALPAAWTTPPPALLKPNADRVAKSNLPSHPDGLPKFLFAGGSDVPDPAIVTTDFFAFDTTADSNHLQALGNACDMGDASLGLVIEGMGNKAPRWAAIRNASDPQIDGTLPPKQQGDVANSIYVTYGAVTSAASVLATWRLICTSYPAPQSAAQGLAAAVSAPVADLSVSLARNRRREVQSDPAHILMQIASSKDREFTDVSSAEVPPETAAALADHLTSLDINMSQVTIDWRRVHYVDEIHRENKLFVAHVKDDSPHDFRGSYLLSGTDIVAKTEFAAQ